MSSKNLKLLQQEITVATGRDKTNTWGEESVEIGKSLNVGVKGRVKNKSKVSKHRWPAEKLRWQGSRSQERKKSKTLVEEIALEEGRVFHTQKWEGRRRDSEMTKGRSADGIHMSWSLFSQWYKVISSKGRNSAVENGLVEYQNRLLSSA